MRVRKTVKIDDCEFVLRELTIAEIIDVFENTSINAEKISDGATSNTKDYLSKEIQRLLNLSFEGEHNFEDFYKMAPSELKVLYDAFKEANGVFFYIATEMGMEKALKEILVSIQKDFSGLLVNSSKVAIQES